MCERDARDRRRIWEFGVSSFVLLLSVPPAAAAKAWRQVAAVGLVSVCLSFHASSGQIARSLAAAWVATSPPPSPYDLAPGQNYTASLLPVSFL
jgi:hypothetical protein